MNRQHCLDAFMGYAQGYDPRNPRIALKVAHTLRVADLCERIAGEEGMAAEEADLAWLAGLLHDIGRFEQVRRYDTFNDAASVSHAELGVEVLFGESDPKTDAPRIRSFVEEDAWDNLLETAIGTHSAYRLPDGLSRQTRTLCEILRDADKIDIIKVNCICPIEDIYGVSEQDMTQSALSPAVEQIFYEHRCLPRGVRTHPADILVGHVCFAWELVFETSLRILREQGHLEQMLARTWELPATQRSFDAMAAHMREVLGL